MTETKPTINELNKKHYIDDIYEKIEQLVMSLEVEKIRTADDVDGLNERTDIGITERAHCINEISRMRADMNAENRDMFEWIERQTVETKRQTKLIGCIVVMVAAHSVWCLKTIAKSMIKARA